MHFPILVAQLGSQSPMGMLFPILAFVGIMYFLMIRPQQKQLKQHQSLLSALKKGDEVVTQSGIIGKIHAIADKEVSLEVTANVRLRVLKTSIQSRVTEAAAAPVSPGPARADEGKEAK